MVDVYKAAAPFIACSLLLIGLILMFPALATWLPGLSH
jgi:TRAP-type mannitol/chloroaromatic compound transport system permease large subunit